MALLRTLTVSTTAFERTKEEFYGFRQTVSLKCDRYLDKNYGVPSTTKFKLSNFVVEHAIVIFEHALVIFKHAIVIFKHAIVQLKYEIRNGMLIFLCNMKPLIGLFKANIHHATMAFIFEGHSTISDVQLRIAPCNHNMQCVIRNAQ